jgi:hypothetical protein
MRHLPTKQLVHYPNITQVLHPLEHTWHCLLAKLEKYPVGQIPIHVLLYKKS